MKVYNYISFLNERGNPYLERKETYLADGRKSYTSPDEVSKFIYSALKIDRCADEYTYCMCLNSKGRLVGLFEASHGTVNGAILSPREVFQKALLLGAVSIILTHNHPSGDPTPSENDISITNKIKKSGELIDIKLLDHIIVAKDGWLSMKSTGII